MCSILGVVEVLAMLQAEAKSESPQSLKSFGGPSCACVGLYPIQRFLVLDSQAKNACLIPEPFFQACLSDFAIPDPLDESPRRFGASLLMVRRRNLAPELRCSEEAWASCS